MYDIKYRDKTEMISSGIASIGCIPKSWSVCQLKFRLSNICNGTTATQIENGELLVSRIESISTGTINFEKTGKIKRSRKARSFKLKKGDVLFSHINSLKMVGKVALYDSDKPLYHGMNLLRLSSYDNYNWFIHFLKSNYFRNSCEAIAKPAINQASISTSNLKQIKIVMLNEIEQQKIANFLDIKIAQFDSIISKKEQLIQKLEEAKKSLISEVVTGKVKIVDDKLVERDLSEMKDSGVEWLGIIPKYWMKSKIKFDTYVKGRIGWQGLKSDEFIDNGPFLVTGTDFNSGRINWKNCYHISEKRYSEAPAIHLENGDLLITKDGTIGKIAMVDNCPEKAILNSGVFVTRCLNNKYLTTYMYYMLQSKMFDTYVDLTSTGSTIKHLYQETFVNFSYCYPNIKEQQRIIDYLNAKVLDTDRLIQKTEYQVNMINQAKQSIISEAVTGKIDLRDWEIIEEGEK